MDFTFRLPVRFSNAPFRPPVLGRDDQLAVDMLHGKHYLDALAGRVFSQTTTPLGLAIPIYTATAIAGSQPIWNPPNSGVNIELIAADVARTSGTADFGAIGLMARKLNAIATGENCTAFADTAPINGMLLVGGSASKAKSSNAGTVTVSAGVAGDFVRNLFTVNLEADTGVAHATTKAREDFDGTVIVPPGVLVYLAMTKASVALFSSTLIWKEIPLVA